MFAPNYWDLVPIKSIIIQETYRHEIQPNLRYGFL
jgi:hypothetical protein